MKKRGASTTTLIVALIVGLLIGAAIVYAAAPSLGIGSSSTPTGLCNGQTYKIGALNDLSGDLSAEGKGALAAENHAIADVNSYLSTSGCNMQFALTADDYKLDTPTALTQLQAMASQGIQVVVGPLNSGAAAGILSYANSNHIVLISPSSTSPALAIAGDYLFRTAPNDAAQGQADAREMVAAGAKAAIIVNRDETYGNGLANATRQYLIADGVSTANIKGPYKYDPTTSDFSAIISQIGSDWTALSNAVGAAHVALFFVSFQELGTLMLQAHNSNPALLQTPLPWFSVDGTAELSPFTNSSSGVGPLAAQVGLASTLFNVVNNSRTIDFLSKLKTSDPSALAAIEGGGAFYCLEAYNDIWLTALATMSAGKYDGAAIHNVFSNVATNFYGLTGWEGLQPSGDRIPGSYQIWKVVASGGAYTWVLAGTWDYNTDAVTYNNGYAPA